MGSPLRWWIGALLLTGFFLPALAENNRQGAVVRVIREAPIYRGPSLTSRKHGFLPGGTLVTLKGERKDELIAVTVELEDRTIDGWMKANGIDMSEDESAAVSDGLGPEGQKKTHPKAVLHAKRLSVPEDEGLLIRREPTFIYGLRGGTVFSIIEDPAANRYIGFGFTGGGEIGTFLTAEMPLLLSVAYTAINTYPTTGTTPTGSPVGIGYLDVGATVQYWIGSFELAATGTYSWAMGVTAMPTTIQFGSVQELSTIWISGGGGYRIPLSGFTTAIVRLDYSMALINSPITIQKIGLQLALDFSG